MISYDEAEKRLLSLKLERATRSAAVLSKPAQTPEPYPHGRDCHFACIVIQPVDFS